MKILIIDDEPDTVTFLTAWLEDEGYRTCSATDGRKGMTTLLREHPDLVLLDVKMPNQTGFQLYREMTKNEECKGIPVIIITGMADFQMFDNECEPLPKPAARIEKPFNLQALRAAIQRALSRR